MNRSPTLEERLLAVERLITSGALGIAALCDHDKHLKRIMADNDKQAELESEK